jgi:hypothetical protein
MNMWTWLIKHKNKFFNVAALALPVVAGIASGGVFTVPVYLAAGAALAGKLAASPLDHSTTIEDEIATASQAVNLAKAVEAAKAK